MSAKINSKFIKNMTFEKNLIKISKIDDVNMKNCDNKK